MAPHRLRTLGAALLVACCIIGCSKDDEFGDAVPDAGHMGSMGGAGGDIGGAGPEGGAGQAGAGGVAGMPSGGAGGEAGEGGEGGATEGQPAPNPEGAALYTMHCVGCHGPQAEGSEQGPSLWHWADVDALAGRIDRTMPTGNPEACTGPCAEAVAAHVLTLRPERPACDALTPPPRRLRLLTRRQYDRSVRDLLAAVEDAPQGVRCDDVAGCDVRTEACGVDGRCVARPCNEYVFLHRPEGGRPSTVHVAGSFNGWPPTVAEGGWPLVWSEALGAFWLARELPEGDHSYKFVIDEAEWITDTSAPDFEDDGFGGRNSRVSVRCDGASPSPSSGLAGLDLIGALPPETRPHGFGYDTYSAAALVTSVHFEAYLEAAEDIVEAALSTDEAVETLAGCAGGEACAEAFVRRFGQRAWRRPLSDGEIDAHTERIIDAESFHEGVRVMVMVYLTAPSFLYRRELGEPVEPAADGTPRWRLTPYEIASALSYTFWGTLPDEALVADAESGALSTPRVIAEHAARLLAHERALPVVKTFALQWLAGEPVTTVQKQPRLYPDFTDEIRSAMATETGDFFAHVMFEGDGRFDTLFDADFTVTDGALARFYGLADDADDGVRPRAYDARRAGALSHGSVLATHAHSDQTSPIRRGLLVRQRLLCQTLPDPPADAGGVPEVDPDATTRARFEQHADSERCRGCHRLIDPIGFGFEHFDAVGRWQDREAAGPIDASGRLDDLEARGAGTSVEFQGLVELSGLLAASDQGARCFAAQLYAFAYGRRAEGADACAAEALYEKLAAGDRELRTVWLALADLEVFTLRGPEEADEGAE
ncbi:MAG: DUF1592 domain-containing protein [Bradymonadia bacterium]